MLKREDMSRLEDVIPKAEDETIAPKRTFKNYKPSFIHIDIKYLPQVPDELKLYNHHIPWRPLDAKTPMQRSRNDKRSVQS